MAYKSKSGFQSTINSDFVSGSDKWSGAEVTAGFIDASDSIQWLDAQGTLTDGATITWDYNSGAEKTVTLGGNRTLTITNLPTDHVVYGTLRIVQDATGGRTLTFPTSKKSGSINTAASSVSIATFRYDGTNLDISIGQYA